MHNMCLFKRQDAGRNVSSDTLIELCLIFLIIFTPLAYGAVEPWGITIFEATSSFMAIFWIFKMLKNGLLEFILTPFNGFIFLLIFYTCLQLFFSHYNTLYPMPHILPRSLYLWATKSELLKIISYSLIFFVTLNTIKTRRQIMRILSVIMTTGFITSIFYLMRYFGVKAPRGIINSDHFSAYLGMIIPFALGFLFVGQQTACSLRILIFFSIIVMSAALFFTMSRGGMLSFIAALLFMAMLVLTRKSIKRKGWVLSAAAIFIILIVAWFGATPVIERILSIKVEIASRYFGGRLPIWQGTLNIIKDYSLSGTGLNTFNYIFPKYQPLQIITKHYTYAHSDILELISELGIPFFVLVTGYWLLVTVYLFRHFKIRHDPWVAGMSIGLFGSLTGIFLHSLVDFNLHISANAILLTLILVTTLVTLNLKNDRFGERVTFRKIYFRFSRISPVTQGILQKILLEILRVSLYPLVLIIFAFYIFTTLRPALADYYLQGVTSLKSQATGYNPGAQTELFERAIKLDPTNAAYHYRLGKLHFELVTNHPSTSLRAGKSQVTRTRELGNAIFEYKKAIELNPTNSRYHQSLAWAYGVLADLEKLSTENSLLATKNAHKEFQRAIDLEPNSPYAHRVYAIWLLNHPTQENVERGVREYRKIIELKPELIGEALVKYYKYQKVYEKLIGILPGTEENDYEVLKFLIKEKGLKFAIDFAEKFLKTYSYNAQMHFWIADRSFYDKEFSWEFTEKHYNIAFKNGPANAYYRMWHGMHLYFRHEYEKALGELELALTTGLGPGDERQTKEYIAKCKEKI